MKASFRSSLLSFLILALGTSALAAGTITVKADGSAFAPLETVELRFTVAGEDAMALDAYKSFKAAKSRSTKALKSLEVAGLVIQGDGMTFGPVAPNPNAIMMMDSAVPPTTKMTIRETLRVVVPVADLSGDEAVTLVSEISDTACEAGMKPAGAAGQDPQLAIILALSGANKPDESEDPFASFRPTDADALRKAAQKSALSAARAMADDLASLSGLAVDGVQSIVVLIAGDWTLAEANRVECRVKLEVVFTTS